MVKNVNSKDRAMHRLNWKEVSVKTPRPLLVKYDRIVEIVRANPGISTGAITKIYYLPTTAGDTHKRMQGMLLQVCFSGRIQCVDNRYFLKD